MVYRMSKSSETAITPENFIINHKKPCYMIKDVHIKKKSLAIA